MIATLSPIQDPLNTNRGPSANFNEQWIKSPKAALTLCTSTGHNVFCFV